MSESLMFRVAKLATIELRLWNEKIELNGAARLDNVSHKQCFYMDTFMGVVIKGPFALSNLEDVRRLERAMQVQTVLNRWCDALSRTEWQMEPGNPDHIWLAYKDAAGGREAGAKLKMNKLGPSGNNLLHQCSAQSASDLFASYDKSQLWQIVVPLVALNLVEPRPRNIDLQHIWQFYHDCYGMIGWDDTLGSEDDKEEEGVQPPAEKKRRITTPWHAALFTSPLTATQVHSLEAVIKKEAACVHRRLMHLEDRVRKTSEPRVVARLLEIVSLLEAEVLGPRPASDDVVNRLGFPTTTGQRVWIFDANKRKIGSGTVLYSFDMHKWVDYVYDCGQTRRTVSPDDETRWLFSQTQRCAIETVDIPARQIANMTLDEERATVDTSTISSQRGMSVGRVVRFCGDYGVVVPTRMSLSGMQQVHFVDAQNRVGVAKHTELMLVADPIRHGRPLEIENYETQILKLSNSNLLQHALKQAGVIV